MNTNRVKLNGLRNNILGFNPLFDTVIDLIAHPAREFEPLRVTAFEFRWIIKRPMFMDAHAEENSGAVFFCISTDCDHVGEV